jgi:hypothetical protein
MVSIDVLCDMGFSRIDQTVIFIMQMGALFAIICFLFFGIQGFQHGTDFGAVVNAALPVFFSSIAWVAEAGYWAQLEEQLDHMNIIKKIKEAMKKRNKGL